MNNKKFILLVVILALILAACSPAVEIQETPTTAPVVDEQPADLLSDAGPAQTGPTCVADPLPPVPSAEDLAAYTANLETDWIKGSENATITFVEYADFQCPYCSDASQMLEDLLVKYPDDVRLVYRHFPLASIHDKAILASQGAEAAGLQGEQFFWDMHDLLFRE